MFRANKDNQNCSNLNFWSFLVYPKPPSSKKGWTMVFVQWSMTRPHQHQPSPTINGPLKQNLFDIHTFIIPIWYNSFKSNIWQETNSWNQFQSWLISENSLTAHRFYQGCLESKYEISVKPSGWPDDLLV